MDISMKSLLAAAVLLLVGIAPAWATDNVIFSETECKTATDGSTGPYCGTNANWYIDPGYFASNLYVRQDDGGWQLVACIGRNASYAQSGVIPINWIWRQHKHEFRFKTQIGCGGGTPTDTPKNVEGRDTLLGFLAMAADNTADYAYVFRQSPSGAQEWLSFQSIWNGKGYTTTPVWSTSLTGAQVFPRHAAHVLARMGYEANIHGHIYGSGDAVNWSQYVAYTQQPSCIIRWGTSGSKFAEYFDPTVNSWMWSSLFGSPPYFLQQELRVVCGGDAEADHAVWIVRMLQNETTNWVYQRNYGVREPSGDRPICNTGAPSACEN